MSDNSVVYFIKRNDGCIKIGVSIDLDTRMKVFTKKYGELRLLGVVPGSYETEKQLQTKFSALRVYTGPGYFSATDWFRPGKSLLSYIKQNAVSDPGEIEKRGLEKVKRVWFDRQLVASATVGLDHEMKLALLRQSEKLQIAQSALLRAIVTNWLAQQGEPIEPIELPDMNWGGNRDKKADA